MKKFNTISLSSSKPLDVLTIKQMSVIRGGTSTATDVLAGLDLPEQSVAGPLCATDDDKRRDRPGGGISTH